MADKNLHASLNFMRRSSLYQTQKPFSIDYRIVHWEGPVPRSNFQSEQVRDIPVGDLRGLEDQFTFDNQGIAVVELQSSMSYEDYLDREKVDKIYCHELASCLISYFDAAAVQIFDIEIRRRHPDFPNVKMRPGMAIQPAARVHLGNTSLTVQDGSRESLNDLMSELDTARPYHGKRHIFVNVWKPLKGPLYDWPLALCDPNTVNPSEDLDCHDHVYKDIARENIMVHYSPQQRWYYLSGQMPSELLIFRQADSCGRNGVPHTAFELLNEPDSPTPPPRESIEVRAIVCFDD